MKARSTQVVVGLWGKESTITRGRGQEKRQDCCTFAKKSSPVPTGISRTSAPANSGPQMWMG
jgi:hypothetical protein